MASNVLNSFKYLKYLQLCNKNEGAFVFLWWRGFDRQFNEGSFIFGKSVNISNSDCKLFAFLDLISLDFISDPADEFKPSDDDFGEKEYSSRLELIGDNWSLLERGVVVEILSFDCDFK